MLKCKWFVVQKIHYTDYTECTGARASCRQNLGQISSTSWEISHSHFLTSNLTQPPICCEYLVLIGPGLSKLTEQNLLKNTHRMHRGKSQLQAKYRANFLDQS